MQGWLLDTNILDYLTDRADAHHGCVRSCFEKIPDMDPVYISAITVGEIEYGIRAFPRMSEARKHDLRHAVQQFPVVDLISSARDCYGRIRAALFERMVKCGRKALRPEQLVDPVTSLRLGLQENDIWITAVALEHCLTLVTHDTKMRPLWEAAGDELTVVDWADPTFAWPTTDSA